MAVSEEEANLVKAAAHKAAKSRTRDHHQPGSALVAGSSAPSSSRRHATRREGPVQRTAPSLIPQTRYHKDEPDVHNLAIRSHLMAMRKEDKAAAAGMALIAKDMYASGIVASPRPPQSQQSSSAASQPAHGGSSSSRQRPSSGRRYSAGPPSQPPPPPPQLPPGGWSRSPRFPPAAAAAPSAAAAQHQPARTHQVMTTIVAFKPVPPTRRSSSQQASGSRLRPHHSHSRFRATLATTPVP